MQSSPPQDSNLQTALAPEIGFLGHRVGDCIKGRYDVKERLGGGNFGSVYRVVDTAVGNVLACKEMHVLDNPNTPQNERAAGLDLFKREALNLATLRHPNIPAAYFDQEEGDWHICPVDGLNWPAEPPENPVCPEHGAQLLPISTRFYLMMDFVDGPTLEEQIETTMRETGRPLDEAKSLDWIYQLALAVRTLHRVGIIHRDIKPDNIKIRSSDNAAVLLDFGLTKKVEEAGGYGTAPLTGTARFGTAGYAPENPRERESPEKRSDIHALGMTLYRLLSGRDPQDLRQLREMREFGPRYFNPDISPETEHLILVAIAPELPMRFQSLDDFIQDLEAIRRPQSSGTSLPPFTFADNSKARNATDLARLLDSHRSESEKYLFGGMFTSWLLQNGFAAPAQAAENITKNHADNPDVALELFRRALYPTGTSNVLPRVEWKPATVNFGSLPSGAREAQSLTIVNAGPGLLWGDLGIPVARKKQKTALASAVGSILAGGVGAEDSSLPGLTVPEWFQGNVQEITLNLDTARVPVGSYSSHIAVQTDNGTERIPVSYTVVPLELTFEPQVLDLGTIEVGRKRTVLLHVVPTDERGGTQRGTLYVGPSLAGVIAPDRFEGREPLPITVDASLPSAVARAYDGLIQLDTNGGRLRVPVRYRITLPASALALTMAQSAVWGGIGGAALRLAYYAVNPDYTTEYLLRKTASGPALAAYVNRGLGPLLAGAALGTYGAWLYGQRLKKLPPRERPGMLKNSDENTLHTLPMIGLVAGTFGGYLGAQLLHWTLWSLGDWLFYPLSRPIPGALGDAARANAPVMWAFIGAFGGLLWGTSKVLSAVGRGNGRVLFSVFMAVLFLILLVNATLSGGSF